jgi:molecular chaperone Hsp33
MADELHKFIFEGLPVRGMLVRLTDSWQEVLRRREQSDAFPEPVRHLMGEMAAAALLMQANIKFNGAVILQIFGDGPVKLAVAEARSDLSFRTTAKVVGELPSADTGRLPLEVMVNVGGQGRCAITLDPQDRHPGQQPYQGVVPLNSAAREPLHQLSDVLARYMHQSEQLETCLVLAADDDVAAGLLIQRMPMQGKGNLEGAALAQGPDLEEIDLNEHYNRIAHLASSLQRDELLTLDVPTILRRLFWEEDVRYFEPMKGAQGPRFECGCSRSKVGHMLKGLGREEIDSIIAEQSQVDVGCEFCGQHYQYDAVDVQELFTDEAQHPPTSTRLQ